MQEEKSPAVYILASKRDGVLYAGVTSALPGKVESPCRESRQINALWNRVATHKDGGVPGLTKNYNVKILVWYEHHHTMEAAIKREKQIKEWKRSWKIELIEKMNPEWCDLHEEIDVISTLIEP